MDHIRLEIQNPDTKEILGPGEVGEIIVKGYNVMKGYLNPDPGLKTIDKDGWLHTEDLGMKDEEGYVRIVGRIKDIIIRGGEDITPLEIEEAILAYDQVSEAKVVGAPHEILGEQVIACLVLKQPNTYSEEELRAILQRKLAPFKHPAHIFLYDSFPLSGSGKISSSKLREDVAKKVFDLVYRT
jgi:fatty-acyl-CoA synthase